MKKLLISPKEFALMFVGTLIVALTINGITAPAGIVTGGVSGLGIIIEAVSPSIIGFAIPISLTTFIINIPLFIWGIVDKGFEFVKKSLYTVVTLTILLELTSLLPNFFSLYDDLFVSSLTIGVGMGLGIGLILKSGATSGGSDMLACIVAPKLPQFPIATLVMMIDAIIVLIGIFVFGAIKAVYAALAIYVTSRVLSIVLEGINYAKATFIISPHNEQIAKEIMEKLPRGTTGIQARGMYSGQKQEMLFTVVSQKQVPKLREIVYTIDPKAFVTFTDVREVLGLGFNRGK